MRIFTTRAFNRLDVAGELGDADLIAAVAEMNDGLWDVNLGGQVYKKRVALAGRSNITPKEKKALKLMARELLGYSNKQLRQALKHGALIEIEVQEDD